MGLGFRVCASAHECSCTTFGVQLDFQQPVESMAQHHTPTCRHEYVPCRPNVVMLIVIVDSWVAWAESTSSATLQAQLSGYGSRLVQIQEVLDRMGVKEPSEMEKWCVLLLVRLLLLWTRDVVRSPFCAGTRSGFTSSWTCS